MKRVVYQSPVCNPLLVLRDGSSEVTRARLVGRTEAEEMRWLSLSIAENCGDFSVTVGFFGRFSDRGA